jgi:hypothetical protein
VKIQLKKIATDKNRSLFLASPNILDWNQIYNWLREVELLGANSAIPTTQAPAA